MNTKEYIIIHHTAVSREDNNNQFQAVKTYHIKKGWGDIGYHYFIETDGTVIKGRDENTTGAHCKEKAMNYRSIGICLTGNFDIEKPTSRQLQVLNLLISRLRRDFNIKSDNVVQHHFFARYKSCPGEKLAPSIINSMAVKKWRPEIKSEPKLSKWAKDDVRWNIMNKVMLNWKFPQSNTKREEQAVINKRLYDLTIKEVKKLLNK